MVAKIAVSAAIYAIDKPYSYRVPAELSVVPGMRVLVPFGKGNRKTEGIVLDISEEDGTKLKCIAACLDPEPVLSEQALRLAAFVRDRYFCTFYEAIRAMLPAGLWFRAVERYQIMPGIENWHEMLNGQAVAAQVMDQLEAMGGQAAYSWLRQQFQDEESLRTALSYLLTKSLVRHESEFLRRANDKMERIASLAVPAEEAMAAAEQKRRSAPMQCAVLELLCTIGSGCTKEICYFTGCNSVTLKRLEKLGFLEFSEVPVLRRVALPASVAPPPIELTEEQQQVFDGISGQWSEVHPGAALLYGITGSGKTAVYMRLIERCLSDGGAAMLLVPEIGLTPQLLQLFAAYFGEQVAVLHSRLRVGERYDEWKRIRSGAARVVIGTRSAVFAPLQNLRLIIVDEEQEHTYRSENAPRYHAREVALFRGIREQALVVLGSATPSVETMYHAQHGRYRLYTLCHRFNGKPLPPVQIVDMKDELRQGNGTAISGLLREQIAKTIARGQQAILFLNRRGTSKCLVCVGCGAVPRCPRCSVNLTYHASNNRLMCHYCGHSEPLPHKCPNCGGPLKPIGTGTQKVVAELETMFPGVRILRMDADTVSAVNSHEKLLSQFVDEKIPILVGTQMVAKGLNFENVTLVGVLDADTYLYADHFRASESTFSMIAQVIGRSGRGKLQGMAVIQTMTPQNAVILLAAEQNYNRFYDMEIELRKIRGCPPFRDLIVFTFSGIFEETVVAGSCLFREQLGKMLQRETNLGDALLLGPAPAPVVKVNNRYRYRLTLCCINSRPMRQLLSHMLQEFEKDHRNRGVRTFVDVNPYD